MELDSTATDPASLGMLGQFLLYLQPQLVVEAGTYKGHFVELVAKVSPRSTLWTADTYDFRVPLALHHHFHHGDFEEMLNQEDLTGIDFAYIDSGPPFVGSFDESVRLRHYEAVKPRMRSGGLVLCHDANQSDWVGFPQIRKESILLAGGRGLTLWQCP